MSDKYKNGKIYTIRYKNDDSLTYVGSTIQPLFKRWFQHKSKVNKEKFNTLLYQKIRETNIEDWYIELYEDCYTYTCIRTYIHTYIQIYMYIYICIYVYIYTYKYKYKYRYKKKYIYIYIYIGIQ